MADTAVLLIDCPDRKGLVATVSGMLFRYGASIVHADQHQDPEGGLFFMRVEWVLNGFDLVAFRQEFARTAGELDMRFRIALRAASSDVSQARVAVFVSQHLHCYVDILHRQQTGELTCSIPLIISNHLAGEPLARFHGVPFHHVPVTAATREQAEREQLRLLAEHRIDLIVLARYMQILSPNFVAEYPRRIINVHHSFLPAFTGARPYHAAFARGVKLIGATSHYVTEALDEGPIIAQDVASISHRNRIEDLVRKGRDLERTVLARALSWHLEHRILCYSNKTVVFD